VHNFWPDLQRCGVRDPTRAALNPGLCNEVDKRLHEWANRNDQGVTAIIAGHTHRAVFENLSLTERRYLESKIKTDGVKIKNQPDGSYYNTGSCVHSLCITGIEITQLRHLEGAKTYSTYRLETRLFSLRCLYCSVLYI
jgi:hypothetical protein